MNINRTYILVFAALLCVGIAQTQDKLHTVSVTGVGVASGLPDRVDLNFQMYSRDEKATNALDENNKKIQRILETLRKADIPDSNITTSNFFVRQDVEYPERDKPKWFYRASSAVKIRLHDIFGVGRIVDALVNDGTTEINTPVFSASFEDSLRNEAYKKAVENAQAKASKLAESFGLSIGKPLQVSVDMGDIEPKKYYYEPEILRLQAGTVIMPYYVTKQVTLNATFEIVDYKK